MSKNTILARLFISATTGLFAGLQAINASAQMEVTARERVLDYVSRQNSVPGTAIDTARQDNIEVVADTAKAQKVEQRVFEPVDNDSEIIVTSPKITAPQLRSTKPNTPKSNAPKPNILPAPLKQKPSAVLVTPPQIKLSEAEREDSIVRELSAARPSKTNKARSFGFFTTAADYLAQRGAAPQPRLTLRYDVSRKNAKTAAMGPSSTLDIIIGIDYAAISKTPDEIVIYDFKEKRLLNLSTADNTFTNASLYAAAYRNLDTVGRMTDGGKKRALTLGSDVTLDAFYLESALGYAAGPPPKDLSVIQQDGKITADFGGKRVFSAMLNGPELEDYHQAFSFIGLLYHSEPVHPAILAELKDVRAAPNAMTFHSFGPKIPDGEIISWTLKSKMSETAEFPLPADAKSAVELESVSPLGFVMSEAVSGRALGGKVDPKSALIIINQQISAGDPLSAWVSAQSLKDMSGGCERVSGLCKAISAAESKKSENTELASLVEALTQIESKTTRMTGLAGLKAMISAPDAPSLVLRRAGIALAKTTPAQRDAAGLADIDPEQLLTQAIARNPYDLLAYQGLAQLSAARGVFIQSWDINDALRAFDGVADNLRAPIDRAESQLETSAPGFFPPVGR